MGEGDDREVLTAILLSWSSVSSSLGLDTELFGSVRAGSDSEVGTHSGVGEDETVPKAPK